MKASEEKKMHSLTQEAAKRVARPLHVLVPLIKQDLEAADEAAKTAGIPYYRAAGQKMIEAKPQMARGEFTPWLKRNFKVSPDRAREYMKLAHATADTENGRASSFSSMNDFHKQTGDPAYMPNKPRPQPWHDPIKDVLGKVDVDLLSIREEEMKRAEERRAKRELALQLIDIGYKALATKLHPDKGGSREAMARLNEVRKALKDSVRY